ncbi:MAG: glyoxalase [Limnothrix sp. RL_2_0]|nr:glyoxalase [Limnothrix sp. RL_2_0]
MVHHEVQNLAIAYVHFYVDDLPHWQTWFQQILGLTPQPPNPRFDHLPQSSVMLAGQGLNIVISAPTSPRDTVDQYLQKHPCGVADIAFFVDDLAPFAPPSFSENLLTIHNPAGFQHTLIRQTKPTSVNQTIDHLVLNVPQGSLSTIADWYVNKFGFDRKQSFQIKTSYSGLSSQVLKHPSGLQLPINQPGDRRSQIQEFLDHNGGAGIQHIALAQDNLPQKIHHLRQQGLTFLDVPQTYYKNLLERHPHLQKLKAWPEVQAEKILIDVVRSPQEMLLQIFTKPIFTEPTFFWEFIERKQQAIGFGEGNFQALFEAIEQAQKQRILTP